MAATTTTSRKVTSASVPQAAALIQAQRNIPKICITLDHLNQDKEKWGLTSLDVAKELVAAKIPVTVFISCTGAGDGGSLLNACNENEEEMISDLIKLGSLITLGIHTLSTSGVPIIPTKANQDSNIDYLINIIKTATGKHPLVASYHGKDAGPDSKIDLISRGIEVVRGISKSDGGIYNTPVLSNQEASFGQLDNIYANTFFFHSNEIFGSSLVKDFYNDIINKVKNGDYQAVAYYQAMKQRYSGK